MKNNAERRIIDFKGHGYSDLIMFGHYRYLNSQSPLKPHYHPSLFEICALKKGHQTFFIGEKRYDMFGGDVFITKPDQIHSTGAEPISRGELYWFQSAHLIKDAGFIGLSPEDSRKLITQLSKLKNHVIHGCASIINILEKAFTIYHDKKNQLHMAEARHLILSFIFEVLHLARQSNIAGQAAGIRKTIDFINSHLDQNTSLAEMARLAGMSESYFKSQFQKEAGIPPAEFRIRARIDKACKLMTDGPKTLTDIAFSLGFSNSQHFATAFKRIKGISPSQFRHTRPSFQKPVHPLPGEGKSFNPIAY